MKNLTEYINEMLCDEEQVKVEETVEESPVTEEEPAAEEPAEKSITDEKSFREAARTKFETVYGDKLDEDKMNKVIDGILNDHKDLVDNGDWGSLIGILNKSFGH